MLLLLLVAVWLAVQGATLLRYPLLSCDEAFYGIAGDRVWHSLLGSPRTVLEPDYYTSLLPYGRINLLGIGLYGLLIPFKAVSVRLWGLTGWLMSCLATYWVAGKLGLKKLAIWPAILVGVAWLPLFYGHNGRPHIWVSAISVFALGLLLNALEDPRPLKLMAVTALPLILLDIHLNSIHFLIANGVLAGVTLLWRKRWSSLIWLALGVVIALPVVAAMRLLPHPDIVLNAVASGHPFSSLAVYSTHTGAKSGGLAAFLGAAPQRAAEFAGWWWNVYASGIALPQGLLFLLGLITAWPHKSQPHRFVAIYTLVSVTSFALFVTFKWTTYAVPWIPLYMLLLVFAVQWLAEDGLPSLKTRIPAAWHARAATILLVPILGMYLAGDGVLLSRPRNQRYLQNIPVLQGAVPAGDSFLSELTWWFALPDAAYADEHLVVTRLQPIPAYAESPLGAEGYIEQTVITDLHIEYVLADGIIGCEDDPSEGGRALTAVVTDVCTPILTLSEDRADDSVRDAILYDCRAAPQP